MCLDPVAVGVDDKGGVVAGAVIGAQAGFSVVAPAIVQRRGVERVHCVRGRCDKAEMQTYFAFGGTGCSAAPIQRATASRP